MLFLMTAILLFFSCQKRVKPVETAVQKTMPASVLNLDNWKITLPFDAEGNDGENSGTAHEIKQGAIKKYILDNYYFVGEKKAVVFRAHAGGAHTSGSGYPRCEYREMLSNGEKAKWQSNEGTHVMEIEQSINVLPIQKKHVVAGQIHSTGDFDDVITCRLESKKLFLSHNGRAGKTLTTNYVLGTRFKLKWVVENDEIKSYFNDQLVETYPLTFPDSYFKAGCYTQSASWGKNDHHNAESSEYGEVLIYKLEVSHN